MIELINATKSARKRTGKMISTRVKQGMIQIVDIVYDDKGRSTVTPLSEYMEGHKVVNALNSIKND